MNTIHPVPEICEAEIVAAIRAATGEVFSTMLGIEITAHEILTPSGAKTPASGLISLIGMAGSWTGTASLACSAEFACKLSSQFLSTQFDGIDEDVLDAMAEITNMIFGNVKTVLEEKVGDMGLSTPTVIFGRNFQARTARTHPWTIVRFTCPEGEMFVQMCLGPNRDGGGAGARSGFQFPHILSI